jgi:hypothetical protein
MENLKLKAVTQIDEFDAVQQAEVIIPFDHRSEESKTNEKVRGMPVTKKLAMELISNQPWTKAGANEIVSVTFDASSLLLLLSQKGCKALRYYYAMKPSGAETMVLIGVDTNGHDLGVPLPQDTTKKASIMVDITGDMDDERSIILEVGGGNLRSDFV